MNYFNRTRPSASRTGITRIVWMITDKLKRFVEVINENPYNSFVQSSIYSVKNRKQMMQMGLMVTEILIKTH